MSQATRILPCGLIVMSLILRLASRDMIDVVLFLRSIHFIRLETGVYTLDSVGWNTVEPVEYKVPKIFWI